MTSSPSTLAELVAPMPVATFRELLRARRFHYQPDAGRSTALLDWDGLFELIGAGGFPAKNFGVYRQSERIPQIFYLGEDGYKVDAIRQLMSTSATILLTGLEQAAPAIGALCASIAAELEENVGATAIATTGGEGAFELHCDVYDMVLLQVDGAKTWNIYGDPLVDPVRGMRRRPVGVPPKLHEIELHQGDWMFLPAGYWHQCAVPGGHSLHLSIKIYPLTAPRVLDLLMREMVGREEDRKPIRFDKDEEAEAEAALKQQLIDRISATSLKELIRLHGAARMVD